MGATSVEAAVASERVWKSRRVSMISSRVGFICYAADYGFELIEA
jgi:hypothetical protein